MVLSFLSMVCLCLAAPLWVVACIQSHLWVSLPAPKSPAGLPISAHWLHLVWGHLGMEGGHFTTEAKLTWGFPKMGVPPNHPFNGIFPYKPSTLGYPHLWKPPCVKKCQRSRVEFHWKGKTDEMRGTCFDVNANNVKAKVTRSMHKEWVRHHFPF